jgi:hypothetical protein
MPVGYHAGDTECIGLPAGLRVAPGRAVGRYPDATAGVARAVPLLMKPGPRDTGKPLTAP